MSNLNLTPILLLIQFFIKTHRLMNIFENRNHYNLLRIWGKNKDKNIIENKYNDIVSKAGKPIQVNINKNEIYFEDEGNNINAKYINIGDKKNYYDNLYYF